MITLYILAAIVVLFLFNLAIGAAVGFDNGGLAGAFAVTFFVTLFFGVFAVTFFWIIPGLANALGSL